MPRIIQGLRGIVMGILMVLLAISAIPFLCLMALACFAGFSLWLIEDYLAPDLPRLDSCQLCGPHALCDSHEVAT